MAKKKPTSNRGEIARLAKQIADHQARIQVIAANWWAMTVAALDATEKKYLAELAKGLAGIRFLQNDPGSIGRLKKLCAKLAAIRAIGWANAAKQIRHEMISLAKNEQHWARRISLELGAGSSDTAEDAKKNDQKKQPVMLGKVSMFETLAVSVA
ncbi:MAG: hypothetical protein E7051_00175 [Lentisphaerae bacterium]|nr:hypothetical protein [Lentisphaerota bacterium]